MKNSATDMTWNAVTAAHEPKIMLFSGAELDFRNPSASSFTIDDIAHGLSLLCRYAGQCRDFYSVAEHCLHVSYLVPEHAFAGLMHDAAEAFVGDITRPLKQMLPQYKKIERSVEEVIFSRFNVSWPIPSAVKQADLALLAAEQAHLMPPGTDRWASDAGIKPASIQIKCLAPRDAEAAFLARFRELQPKSVRNLVAVT